MVEFYSEHNVAQTKYERSCAEANASWGRAELYEGTIRKLIEGGPEAVVHYEQLLDKRWAEATCNAEFDGVRIEYWIAKQARERLGMDPRGQKNATT